MEEVIRTKILALLDQHRNMTLATLRPDGWPQATTVGYANDGLTLYFLCGLDSQKATNLARDNRVSLTIDDDTPEIMEITGLSMAARAAARGRSSGSGECVASADAEVPGAEIPAVVSADADSRGRLHISPDPDRDLCSGLLQGLWAHGSCHLLACTGDWN